MTPSSEKIVRGANKQQRFVTMEIKFHSMILILKTLKENGKLNILKLDKHKKQKHTVLDWRVLEE